MKDTDNSVKEMIDQLVTDVEARIHSDLECDGICSVTAGLLKTWFERGNTTMIVNAPLGGWHTDVPVMPNVKDGIEQYLEFDHQNILRKLGVSSDVWDKIDCKLVVSETLTNDNPIARGIPPTERPVYLIISRTITDFDEASRKIIIGYLVEAAISMVSFLLLKTDLKPNQPKVVRS